MWDEKNWERLLDSLKNCNSSHYLGAIIIKMDARQNDNGFYCYSVIDGQQRITTLSILMRALMDNLHNNTVSNALNCMLFCRHDPSKRYTATSRGKKNAVVKLVPGFHDKNAYTALIENPEQAIKDYPSNQLIACYKYFKEATTTRTLATSIYKLLNNENINFIVKISLAENDNAQAIFDVSNGTGVSLTCADIIKNNLFSRINEGSRLSVYRNTWEQVFDNKDYEYWTDIYNSRTNMQRRSLHRGQCRCR